MSTSILTKSQTKTLSFSGFRVDGGAGSMKVTIRYDDQCGNGHNSFSVTGELFRDSISVSCGMIHDDIREFAPELAPLLKWHLCDSTGPMHYIANTLYHISTPDLAAARSTAIAPNATVEQLSDKAWLGARLPALLEEFQAMIESLGFTY